MIITRTPPAPKIMISIVLSDGSGVVDDVVVVTFVKVVVILVVVVIVVVVAVVALGIECSLP